MTKEEAYTTVDDLNIGDSVRLIYMSPGPTVKHLWYREWEFDSTVLEVDKEKKLWIGTTYNGKRSKYWKKYPTKGMVSHKDKVHRIVDHSWDEYLAYLESKEETK